MTAESPGLVPAEEEQLADLRRHWDASYEISRTGKAWAARFLAGTDRLSAYTADELRALVRLDYAGRRAADGAADKPTRSRAWDGHRVRASLRGRELS